MRDSSGSRTVPNKNGQKIPTLVPCNIFTQTNVEIKGNIPIDCKLHIMVD